MTGPISKKIGIKEGMRAIFINAPEGMIDAFDLTPLNVASKLNGDFDYIHFFTTSQRELEDNFPKLKNHLKPTGMLWISWPKNKKLNTNLTMPKIIKVGYERGLVESKCVSIDATWSAIKFTAPIKGKVYKNTYGQLKL